MKKPEQYFCDVCHNEFAPEKTGFIQLRLHVITNCEWEEGYSTQSRIESHSADICCNCFLKSTNLKCGFRGEKLKLIHKESNNA